MTNGRKRPPSQVELKASLKDAELFSDAHVEICNAAGIALDTRHGATTSEYRHLVESWKSVFTGVNIIVNRLRAKKAAADSDHTSKVNRLEASKDRIERERDEYHAEALRLTQLLSETETENLGHRVTDIFRRESMIEAPVATKVLSELSG